MKGRNTLFAVAIFAWALTAACGSDDDGGPTGPPVVPGGPTATITSPAANSAYTTGQRIEFRGTATDDEDGVLPDASLAWSSDRDGAMGTGTSLDYKDLSVGSHTVRLTATDSDGLQGFATVAVTVNEVPILPPIPPGAVLLQDDMDDENNGVAKTNYTGFENWNVTRECVDLHGPGSIDPMPGNGLYIDMDGSCDSAGRMESKEVFTLEVKTYKLEMVIGGNNQDAPTDNMTITLGAWSETITVPEDEPFNIRTFTIPVSAATNARLILDHAGADMQGILIDAIRLSEN
jgi:hypothetical protein